MGRIVRASSPAARAHVYLLGMSTVKEVGERASAWARPRPPADDLMLNPTKRYKLLFHTRLHISARGMALEGTPSSALGEEAPRTDEAIAAARDSGQWLKTADDLRMAKGPLLAPPSQGPAPEQGQSTPIIVKNKRGEVVAVGTLPGSRSPQPPSGGGPPQMQPQKLQPPTPEVEREIAHVEAIKSDGNAAFRAGDLDQAMGFYSCCLQLLEQPPLAATHQVSQVRRVSGPGAFRPRFSPARARMHA